MKFNRSQLYVETFQSYLQASDPRLSAVVDGDVEKGDARHVVVVKDVLQLLHVVRDIAEELCRSSLVQIGECDFDDRCTLPIKVLDLGDHATDGHEYCAILHRTVVAHYVVERAEWYLRDRDAARVFWAESFGV